MAAKITGSFSDLYSVLMVCYIGPQLLGKAKLNGNKITCILKTLMAAGIYGFTIFISLMCGGGSMFICPSYIQEHTYVLDYKIKLNTKTYK